MKTFAKHSDHDSRAAAHHDSGHQSFSSNPPAQFTINEDWAEVLEVYRTKSNPLLRNIINEVIAAGLITPKRYGDSDYGSENNIDHSGGIGNFTYEAIIDDGSFNADQRPSILLHELMHTVVDQKYLVNQNPLDLGSYTNNIIDSVHPDKTPRKQLEFIRVRLQELKNDIARDRNAIGNATAQYLLRRIERADGSTAQEFDTVMSELYFYWKQHEMDESLGTFKRLEALTQAAYDTRNTQTPVMDNYVAPDEGDDGGFCFITTACVSSQGLPDNCEELSVLRSYRDSYIRHLPDGDLLLKTYYELSPHINSSIAQRDDEKEIYRRLYAIIRTCVEQVKKKENEAALHIYVTMLLQLHKEFIPQLPIPDDVNEICRNIIQQN